MQAEEYLARLCETKRATELLVPFIQSWKSESFGRLLHSMYTVCPPIRYATSKTRCNAIEIKLWIKSSTYGYYDSKEALFEALVSEQYDYFMNCFNKAQQEFADMPPEEQPDNLSTTSGECMHEMLLYAYEHLNEFKLILCHSEGARFSKLIDEMVEIETKGTHDYSAAWRDRKIWKRKIAEDRKHFQYRN